VLLLRRQLVVGVDVAPADLFAGGEQLRPCPLGERLGARRVELLVGRMEVFARFGSARPSSQELPKHEVGTG